MIYVKSRFLKTFGGVATKLDDVWKSKKKCLRKYLAKISQKLEGLFKIILNYKIREFWFGWTFKSSIVWIVGFQKALFG